jgi:hypothetical protein
MGSNPIYTHKQHSNIEVLFLIAHASDQVQPLDLLTFAMMKQTFSASKGNRLVNPYQMKWFVCWVPDSQRVPLTTMLKPSFLWD